jgi:uncharacterized protein (TIGR03067 family)
MFLIVAACLSIGADDPKETAVKKELQRFHGTWVFTLINIGGTDVPAEQVKGAKLVIEGNRFTVTDPTATYRGTFKVDPAAKPKTIDMTFTEGPEKGKTTQGIYELEGDVYKVCVDVAGKGRPTEFVSKPGSGHVFELLKRVKP